jgi:hypothetical protein
MGGQPEYVRNVPHGHESACQGNLTAQRAVAVNRAFTATVGVATCGSPDP